MLSCRHNPAQRKGSWGGVDALVHKVSSNIGMDGTMMDGGFTGAMREITAAVALSMGQNMY